MYLAITGKFFPKRGTPLPRAGVLCVLLLIPLVFGAAPAWAEARYGAARLAKGKMTVLRAGGRQVYRKTGEAVPILHGDVIRVGARSSVVLKTVEKSILTLGGNAVFQVKPWQSREKRGLLRILYGRFRAAISGLSGGERFNVRTATATIGVKGTGYTAAAPPQGDALVIVRESVVQLAGQDGVEQAVPEGFVSVVINGGSAKPPVPAPPELLAALAEQGLDAPSPNSPEALELPALQVLIEAGIVTQEEADASAAAGAGVDPDSPQSSGAGAQSQQAGEEAAGNQSQPSFPDPAEQVLDAIEQTTQDSANEVGGPRASLNLRFER